MLARTQKHRNTVADAVEEICFREKAENAQEQYFTPALLSPPCSLTHAKHQQPISLIVVAMSARYFG